VSVLVSTCTHARICEFAHYLVAEIVYSCCVPLVRGPKFRRSLAFCRQPCVHIHKRHYSFRNQDLRCMIYYYCSCTIHIRVHLSVHPCVHTKPNAHTQRTRNLRWASFQWTSGALLCAISPCQSLFSAPFHRANRVACVRFEEARNKDQDRLCFAYTAAIAAQFKSADMPSACPVHCLSVLCTLATAHRVQGKKRGRSLLPGRGERDLRVRNNKPSCACR
jgi:hypothetical protein